MLLKTATVLYIVAKEGKAPISMMKRLVFKEKKKKKSLLNNGTITATSNIFVTIGIIISTEEYMMLDISLR